MMIMSSSSILPSMELFCWLPCWLQGASGILGPGALLTDSTLGCCADVCLGVWFLGGSAGVLGKGAGVGIF